MKAVYTWTGFNSRSQRPSEEAGAQFIRGETDSRAGTANILDSRSKKLSDTSEAHKLVFLKKIQSKCNQREKKREREKEKEKKAVSHQSIFAENRC